MQPLPAPADWQIGQIIHNRYAVLSILGEGGMGRVYKVYHRDLKREVAVKCPKPSLFARTEGKDLFVREAEQWVRLEGHPHIVQCYYVETMMSIPRIVAEYLAGGSLKDWMSDPDRRLYAGGPRHALARILDIAIQMAWGLDSAHQQGLVHQDVKPANVLLTPEGTAKITDFGLAQARFLAGETPGSGRVGASQVVPGVGLMTPAYASPEQVEGKPLSRQSDLWSWAVSVLECFVGALTWRSGSVAGEVLEGYLAAGPDDPALPAMPPGVVTLLRQCFQRGPAARPATMQAVAAALEAMYEEVLDQPYLRQVPKPETASAAIWNSRAISLRELGKPEEALAASEHALRLDPQEAGTWVNKGITLHALQRHEEALAAYEQAIRLAPTVDLSYTGKALALRALGREAEAAQVEAQVRARRGHP